MDVYPGSVKIDIEGSKEAVQKLVDDVSENGLSLPSFLDLTPIGKKCVRVKHAVRIKC